MDDARAALRTWVRHAAAAYGDDLPVAAAGVLRPVPAVAAGPSEPAPSRAAPPGAEPEAAAAPVAAPPRPTPARARAPARRSESDATARADRAPSPTAEPAADLPTDLEQLRRMVTTCRRCKLCDHRTQTVFGEGAPDAAVMFVGEAPGAREDEQGRPFVGPAGRLLTRIVENAMGLRRDEVYIANVNKCRPPGNRNPEPDEIAACLPFLRAQIRAIRPRVLVALGRVAAHNLLGTSLSMTQLRGRDLECEGLPVVATWHPAYLLRNPDAKRDTWEDIKRVNRLLGRPEVPPRRGA